MAQFSTKLPKEIKLSGNWEVGLSDIIFPSKFVLPAETIRLQQLPVQLDTERSDIPPPIEDLSDDETSPTLEEERYHTDKKDFASAADLIAHLNSKVSQASPDSDHEDKLYFQLDRYDFVSIVIPPRKNLIMSERLRSILGFREDSLSEDYKNTGMVKRTIHAAASCYMFHVYTMYIYTDIVQPNVVGDKMSQLLDIIPVQSGDRFTLNTYRMEKPRYVPLLQKTINFPSISLMMDNAEPMPFADTGRVVVKLHFKKV